MSSDVNYKRSALRHSFGAYRMEILRNAGAVSLEMGNSAAMLDEALLRHRGRSSGAGVLRYQASATGQHRADGRATETRLNYDLIFQ